MIRKGENMDKYTKFILTVIAIAMIGILFKGEKIITSAHAIEKHTHYYPDIYAKGGDFFGWLNILFKVVVGQDKTNRDQQIQYFVGNSK